VSLACSSVISESDLLATMSTASGLDNAERRVPA
jgi:hypothetical protein